MTVAAIYARFSSDSQREESIEIQVEQCSAYIERQGWEIGEVFTDYARSGTNDNRPGFQTAIEQGKLGAYDVLVVMRNDRFARNIEDSRKYKRILKESGRRFVSVREGESKDNPASFLHETMDEAFAEYYSRMLSVNVREGIAKNAQDLKASGVRIFGYDVDATDHFVINEEQAAMVREVFEKYAAGATANSLSDLMAERGFLTLRGNKWTPNAVTKLLHNEAYKGVYDYAGTRDENGMPTIVDRALFDLVQDMMLIRKNAKRKSNMNDYILTTKLYCLDCGEPMQGQSGTGKSGKKYTYYACLTKDGCKMRVPSEPLEAAVVSAVRDQITDPSTVSLMVESLLDYADSIPNNIDVYKDELKEVTRRRRNLVNSLAEGIPASAIKEELEACEKRSGELESLIAKEEWERGQLLDEDQVRGFIERYITKDDVRHNQLLIDTFVDAIYADTNDVFVLFHMGGDLIQPSLEEIQKMRTLENDEFKRCSHLMPMVGIDYLSANTKYLKETTFVIYIVY